MPRRHCDTAQTGKTHATRVTIRVPVTASAASGHRPVLPSSRTSVGSSSPMRAKTTLSSRKMTVWYTECGCSRVCAVVIFERHAPIASPATITAVTPETCRVWPSRYATYGAGGT